MVYKLDKIDKKLLTYLYHNYRLPLTKIAKKCNISRDQVEYRIRKFEQDKIIKKYATLFNYNKLGYNQFVIVWFKLKKDKSIKKDLESMNNILSYGDVINDFDLYVNFIFKNNNEYQKIFNEFLEKHKDSIKDYEVFQISFSEFYPLNFIQNNCIETNYRIISEQDKLEISNKDYELMTILEKNGRIRFIDIAKKIDLSSELIIYKMKQMQEKKLILGSRIIFNMENLGYNFGLILIKLINISDKVKNKINHFSKHNNEVNGLCFGNGNYNCLVQIMYKDEKEFRETIKKIHNLMKNYIQETRILLIENESDVNTLPFRYS